MQGHRDLVVWQKSMELLTAVHRATRRFPKEELFVLTTQMRRAALSVPCNIAEGHGRNTRKEFHQFIGYARGSLVELETQLEAAQNLGYLTSAQASELLKRASEVARLLNGLRDWAEKSLTPDS